MVPLQVRNDTFVNSSKPDIFDQSDKKRARKSPVVRDQLLNSDSANDLQHM